jgi:topoisomerase-4 subunit A
MEESDIIPSEPVTVILSSMGWVRAAKGHDIEGASVSYKASDAFKMAAQGRSQQLAIFIDSTGRSYSLPAHTLPSARGQGEPLTGRLNPPAGATFEAVIMGEEKQLFLLASDAGYGFVVELSELHSKNRAGKAILKLPNNSRVLPPRLVKNAKRDRVAAVTNTGHLLLFPISELPQLPRGKGNKIINISSAKVAKREEYVVDIAVLEEGSALLLLSGRRSLTLKAADLDHYQGERGRRGSKLPRGFQKVDRLVVEN